MHSVLQGQLEQATARSEQLHLEQQHAHKMQTQLGSQRWDVQSPTAAASPSSPPNLAHAEAALSQEREMLRL
eukprot:CAMPEP_0202849970 /NCGR_PEP_ID=MMETSP1389-20130828/82343_1 /ASSEMBLY_ACC=CAM_ASM_000865 /TAXON_ID=302021 /ORGANISM="Rhodomonas sp., Strain CCMP768" /LENGTH=71 /DNA_ID=CAMNT_0049528099 /DNA_START=1 /DNA_END=212 /DNA_ORIENTATION=-